jgi:hypothetical protein
LQFDVQKAEQEKLAAIIRSEGESEAAKILTSARNPPLAPLFLI